jgi:hypothetical protein
MAPVLSTPAQLNESGFIDPHTFGVPGNFMGFTFEPIKEHDSSIENNAVYVDSEPKFLSLNEWVLKKDNIKKEEFERLKDSVREFAELELAKKGWVTDLRLNGHILGPLSANGPGGGIWGYLKEDKGRIQVILIEENGLSSKIEPSNNLNDCPCSLRFRIFVSNVSELSTILK